MRKVCIDMGHGGKDPGARGGGMNEKKINYNVGMELKKLLLQDGYEVVMTRQNDEYLGLTERALIANKSKADILVSIHHNAGGSGKGDGFEVYYQIDPTVTMGSKRLAFEIGPEFEKLNNKRKITFKASTRDAKEDYYTILARAKMPAVIAEFAFLDSVDVQSVDTLTEQWAQAGALHRAIKKYFGGK